MTFSVYTEAKPEQIAIPNVAQIPLKVSFESSSVSLVDFKLHIITPTVSNTRDITWIYLSFFRRTTPAKTAVNNNLICDKTANKAGRKASKLCRERGIKIGDCGSTKFGKIGAYPEEILHEVFDILDI